MQVLTRLGDVVHPYLELFEVLKRALEAFSTPDRALQELRNYVDNPGVGLVADLLEAAGVEAEDLEGLLDEYETEIDLLLGKSLAEVDDELLNWPLKAHGQQQTGEIALRGEAELTLEIDVDTDGEALEGAIVFDEEKEALTGLSVHGKVSAGADVSAPIGAINASAAFGIGGEVTLENFFLHDRSEAALSALINDSKRFRLPGGVNSFGDLHSSRGGTHEIRVKPLQWVRMAGSGKIDVGGGLSWGRNFVQTGRISKRSLDLDAPIEVSTGLSTSLGVSYGIEGDFDLLISASDDNPGWLSVSLARSQSSRFRSTFTAGAGIGITGLDQVARKVVDSFLPKLDELVGKLEENVDDFPKLKTLFRDSLEKQLDKLLEGTDLDDRIDGLLATVVAEADLKALLQRIARDRVLNLTGEEIDDIDEHLEELRGTISDLIGEDRLGEIPSLRELLIKALDRQLDSLLEDTDIDDEIDGWIAAISDAGDLKSKLLEILQEAAIDFAGEYLDDLEANADQIREAIKKLIGKYRKTIERIEGYIKKAADLKVGIEIARTRQRMHRKGIDLIIDVDIDEHPVVFRDMLWGSFSKAMQLAQDTSQMGIKVSGLFEESGSLTLNESLSINIFDLPINQATILRQTWAATVSTSGDITIALKGMVKTVDSWWRGAKVFTFLADARVAGLVSGESTEVHELNNTVTIELAREKWRPKRKKLKKYASRLEGLGITEGATSMVDDLIPPPRNRAKSKLSCSVQLKLSEADLDNFLEAGLERAQLVFVHNLLAFYISGVKSTIDVDDPSGLPFLLWPSLRNSYRSFPRSASVIVKSGETSVRLTRDEQRIVKFLCMQITSFSTLYSKLRSLQKVPFLSTPEGRARWVITHRQMLKEVKALMPTGLFDRYEVGEVLFRTIFVLANTNGQLDPFVVVGRDEDDQIFVYG